MVEVSGEAGTHLVFWRIHFLHVALVWFAVWELPQLLRRLLVQLAADLFALAAVGEVVRRESAVVEAVDIGAEAEQTADQRWVLKVDREVKRCPTAALFLQTRMFTSVGSPSARFHVKRLNWWTKDFTCALMSAPRRTRLSTKEM